MAVGAGSIKRASKLNAEATEVKTTVAAEAKETKASETPVKKTTRKTSTAKTTATKSTAAKSAAKTAASDKAAKEAVLPKEEPVTNVMVPTPEVMQEVVKIASSHKVCRLTEDLPVHLL